jgi:hypothetical protein
MPVRRQPIEAVYRKHFLNPIRKTRGFSPSCLTLSCPVGYHRSQWSWSKLRYDASIDKAIDRRTLGALPARGRRTRLGPSHFTRISPRTPSQGHARDRALHVDVRCRTSARHGDCTRTGGACADFSDRTFFDLGVLVSFPLPTSLSRSSNLSHRIVDSKGASDPVQVP